MLQASGTTVLGGHSEVAFIDAQRAPSRAAFVITALSKRNIP